MSVLVTLDTTKQTRESKDLEPATIPIWVVGFYHVTAFVSLISLLYVVVSVTAVSVWAPQLALRGLVCLRELRHLAFPQRPAISGSS